MKKICLVTTTMYPVEVFLLDQIRQMSKEYAVTVVTNTDELDFFEKRGMDAKIIRAPIERKIHLLKDVKALLRLVRIFRAEHFDVVHSVTPKAGLLSTVAGFVTRIPIRIHTFTGLVWDTQFGMKLLILKAADKATATFATHILADSFTQRDVLIRKGVVSAEKSGVLANGSLSGVDTERFQPNVDSRAKIRRLHGIPDDALVFLFMARLTRDKGSLVMAEGFAKYNVPGDPISHLIVAGPDEEGLRPRILEICRECSARVHFVNYTLVPEQYMAASDVFCLPSYREGFGTALINAASVGIPAIASRIYGSEEAIEENMTGLLHEAGNSTELAQKMHQLAHDLPLRKRLGENGMLRARRNFSEAAVTTAVLRFYEDVMSSARAAR
jgi:glycosyltransferase involved in cell wall biosynthesis